MLIEWQAMPLSRYWHIPVKKKFCDLGLHSCSLTSVVAWYAPGMLLSCYRQITGYTKKYSKLGLHSCSLSSVLVWYATVMPLTHCRLKKQQQWPRPALMFTEQCASLVCHCHATDTLQVKKNNNSDLGLHSSSLSSVLVWYATVMLLTHCRLKKTTTVT